MYYTYILRCEDGSLYTGITADVRKRFNEHLKQGSKCAKYTRVHKVKSIEAVWQSESRSTASRLEYQIKKLEKNKKELLIKNNTLEILSEKLKIEDYKKVEKL